MYLFVIRTIFAAYLVKNLGLVQADYSEDVRYVVSVAHCREEFHPPNVIVRAVSSLILKLTEVHAKGRWWEICGKAPAFRVSAVHLGNDRRMR